MSRNTRTPARPRARKKAVRAAPSPRRHKKAEAASGQLARTATAEEIARLAFSYWEQRGRTGGSADEDWFRAEKELANIGEGA